MGLIHKLATHVVNQIAAGEVIERPASVVKELVENAIDAGAQRIGVSVEAGGIELVSVVDDGCGIEPDDFALAVCPHATSKLEKAEELDAIATLGFRGEALAAIASVSRLSVISRSASQPTAMRLEVSAENAGDGGSELEIEPCAGPCGTTISVRNLFYNTPARRKFLRTVTTEMGHVQECVQRLALSQPRIGFRLTHNDKTVLELEPGQSPRARVLAVVGRELERELIEVSTDGSESAACIAIWGLIGTPAIARASAKYQHVFLNGRWVRDKTVLHAIKEAYRGLIDPTRFPMAVLHIEMDPAQVDVNVHPAKAEVRFRDSQSVHGAVLSAIRQRLRASDLTPAVAVGAGSSSGNGNGHGDGGGFLSPRWEVPDRVARWPGADRARGAFDPDSGDGEGDRRLGVVETASSAARRFVEYFKTLDPTQRGFAYREIKDAIAREDMEVDQQAAESAPASSTTAGLRDADAPRVLQVHDSYLVIEDADGLCIVDQHALHERIMFEDLKARILQGNLESQRLLMPAVVEVSPEQAARLEEFGPLLTRIGIEAEALGPASIGVHAFASFLFERGVDCVEFVGELIDKASERGWTSVTDDEAALHEVLDMMSCKAAIKAGDRLDEAEIHALLARQRAIERSSRCPHGRPTTIRLSLHELERQFGRR